MNYAQKMVKRVRDRQTAPALIEVIELLDTVLDEIEKTNDKAYLEELGWQLVRIVGEDNSASLCRSVGAHIVHKRTSTWKAADGGKK